MRLLRDRVEPGAAGAGSSNIGERTHLVAVARGWALNLVGAASYGILSFLLVVIITRALGPGSAGAFFEAIALFNILTAVSALGSDVGAVRTVSSLRALHRAPEIPKVLAAGVGPVLFGSILLAVAVFVFAPTLAGIFADGAHAPVLADYLRALALFLPLSAVLTVLVAASRGFGTMVPATVIDRIGRPGLQPALVTVVLVAGLGGTALAVAWATPIALATGAAALWLGSLVRRSLRADPGTGTSRRLARVAGDFWRFAGPRGLAAAFQVTIVWLDTLLIGALGSTREAGIYSAATRYVLIGILVATAIIQILAPKISELLALGDRSGAARVYQTSTAWLIVANWPIYLTLALFAPMFLALFGPGFGEGQLPLIILATTMLVATGVGPVDVILLMAGKSGWNLANTVVALFLNVVLNLLLIPRLGITGAAIAWSVSILFNNLAPLIQVWMLLRLHPFGPGFARAVAAAALSYGALGLAARWLVGGSVAGFALAAVAASALYVVLLRRSRHALDVAAVREAIRLRAGKVRA